MNYHPVLLTYTGSSNKNHLRYFHELAVRCLGDYNKVMSFNWKLLANAMGDSGLRSVLDRVYNVGWDHDEETRQMKKRFEDIVNFNDLANKSLGDYL